MPEKELTYAEQTRLNILNSKRKLIFDALPLDTAGIAVSTGLGIKLVRGHLKHMVEQRLVHVGRKEKNFRGSEKHIYYTGQGDGTVQGTAEMLVAKAVRTQRNSIFDDINDRPRSAHTTIVGTHKSVWVTP